MNYSVSEKMEESEITSCHPVGANELSIFPSLVGVPHLIVPVFRRLCFRRTQFKSVA